MIHFSNILAEETSFACSFMSSKKRALEFVSEVAAKQVESLNQVEINQGLLKRERLGTTAVGHGIAIPHCRIEGLEKPLAILLQLKQGIDFAAPDGEAVDIVIALLVPNESTDEHLQLLAQVAELFGQKNLREKIRRSTNNHELYQTVISWQKQKS
jgi:nitrogen PTS system EIIA component